MFNINGCLYYVSYYFYLWESHSCCWMLLIYPGVLAQMKMFPHRAQCKDSPPPSVACACRVWHNFPLFPRIKVPLNFATSFLIMWQPCLMRTVALLWKNNPVVTCIYFPEVEWPKEKNGLFVFTSFDPYVCGSTWVYIGLIPQRDACCNFTRNKDENVLPIHLQWFFYKVLMLYRIIVSFVDQSGGLLVIVEKSIDLGIRELGERL